MIRRTRARVEWQTRLQPRLSQNESSHDTCLTDPTACDVPCPSAQASLTPIKLLPVKKKTMGQCSKDNHERIEVQSHRSQKQINMILMWTPSSKEISGQFWTNAGQHTNQMVKDRLHITSAPPHWLQKRTFKRTPSSTTIHLNNYNGHFGTEFMTFFHIPVSTQKFLFDTHFFLRYLKNAINKSEVSSWTHSKAT